MENFGNRLRAIREKRGLTQLQAAKELAKVSCITSCTRKYFTRYETGRIWPSSYKLHDICVALNVSADYLLGLSDKEDLK